MKWLTIYLCDPMYNMHTMNTSKLALSLRTNPFLQCALLAFTYLLFIILLPASHNTMQQYGWAASEYRVVYLIIVIPVLAIWFSAFYGAYRLQSFAEIVKSTPDGYDYANLARGVKWLAWSLPIPSLIAVCLNAIANQSPGFHATAIIIVTYISLLMPLVAFTLISRASRGLLKRAKIHISISDSRGIIFLFVIFGVVFCYLTFRHLNFTSYNSSNNPYYLPAWLMVLTVIIPYLYAWFIGLLAAFEIAMLAAKSQGLLYRQALRFCAIGFATVIASSVVLQYISSVTPRTGHLELNYRLLATYTMRIVIGAGFVLLAIGANRLRKIEEV